MTPLCFMGESQEKGRWMIREGVRKRSRCERNEGEKGVGLGCLTLFTSEPTQSAIYDVRIATIKKLNQPL